MSSRLAPLELIDDDVFHAGVEADVDTSLCHAISLSAQVEGDPHLAKIPTVDACTAVREPEAKVLARPAFTRADSTQTVLGSVTPGKPQVANVDVIQSTAVDFPPAGILAPMDGTITVGADHSYPPMAQVELAWRRDGRPPSIHREDLWDQLRKSVDTLCFYLPRIRCSRSWRWNSRSQSGPAILSTARSNPLCAHVLRILRSRMAFATQLGLCNAYFATLDKPLLWTGLLHGIYGIGAFVSPLIATAMVTRGIPYHIFYTTNIGINVPVFAAVWFAFRNLHSLPQHSAEITPANEISTSAFRATLKSRAVWSLAIFLMLYVGAEESIGGWIVSYILEVRKGSPEGASWVASCFYLGIALGRIFLPTLNMLIGERLAVILYLLCAIALECLAWFLPYLASTALCPALVGVAISTLYAAAITTGGASPA
ncbi:hypothetical protein A0H81_09628 [Grifola frondosa]|uniref:Bypass of stop codon protein 6 n=1 Tax=Grifola frondosa TaxID=5627 RepID=A0A1C7LZT7_GRIFR|nr:hypothetical protein A0H81_09628 [Grifola frondosa]